MCLISLSTKYMVHMLKSLTVLSEDNYIISVFILHDYHIFM